MEAIRTAIDTMRQEEHLAEAVAWNLGFSSFLGSPILRATADGLDATLISMEAQTHYTRVLNTAGTTCSQTSNTAGTTYSNVYYSTYTLENAYVYHSAYSTTYSQASNTAGTTYSQTTNKVNQGCSSQVGDGRAGNSSNFSTRVINTNTTVHSQTSNTAGATNSQTLHSAGAYMVNTPFYHGAGNGHTSNTAGTTYSQTNHTAATTYTES